MSDGSAATANGSQQLVAEIRDRLARLGAPRLQLLLILVLAGTAAFMASVTGLWLGVASMTLRYAVATVAGYLTFIALLRAWIAWQRGSWPDLDVGPDLLDLDFDVPRSGSPGDARFFAGALTRGTVARRPLALSLAQRGSFLAPAQAALHPRPHTDSCVVVCLPGAGLLPVRETIRGFAGPGSELQPAVGWFGATG